MAKKVLVGLTWKRSALTLPQGFTGLLYKSCRFRPESGRVGQMVDERLIDEIKREEPELRFSDS
jgi:hypothetical protein